MANYLLAYHGGGMPETEEEQQRVLAAWGEWYQQLGSAVVDGGRPIVRTVLIDSGGAGSDSVPNPVSGYTIVAADTMDAAVAHAKGCPILRGGGSIEVGETIEMG